MKSKIIILLLFISCTMFSQIEDCGQFCEGETIFFAIDCGAGTTATTDYPSAVAVAGGFEIVVPADTGFPVGICFTCVCDDPLEDGITLCESEEECKTFTVGFQDLTCDCEINYIGNGTGYAVDADCATETCVDVQLRVSEAGLDYSWSTGATTQFINVGYEDQNCDPTPATYQVTVTDPNGCAEEVKIFTITPKCTEINAVICPPGN